VDEKAGADPSAIRRRGCKSEIPGFTSTPFITELNSLTSQINLNAYQGHFFSSLLEELVIGDW